MVEGVREYVRCDYWTIYGFKTKDTDKWAVYQLYVGDHGHIQEFMMGAKGERHGFMRSFDVRGTVRTQYYIDGSRTGLLKDYNEKGDCTNTFDYDKEFYNR